MKENHFYRAVRGLAWAICKVVFPWQAEGTENIPAEGPVLLCSNHVSLVDPVLLACSFPRRVTFLAKKELFSTRFTDWFFRSLGMVPVDRGASDIQALRVCLGVLNEGGLLGIFPQGHRYRQDEYRQLQNGAAMMALRSRATVVPVHVSAPLRAFRKTRIRFGQAIDLSDLTRANAQTIQTTTLRITEAIWQEEK